MALTVNGMDAIIRPVDEQPLPFVDLVGLARLRIAERQRHALAERGFDPFRRGDGAWVRILAEGPLTIGEVAAVIGQSRQNATRIADSLEQRGYVQRILDDGDRRRVVLQLTPLGHGYAEAFTEVVEELEREVAALVDQADLYRAHRVLGTIVDALPARSADE
jgi:DNA-binding MarR family transcriptional regulator